MKYIPLYGLLVFCGVGFAQYNGLGASTTSCLDKDGDGYGVGPLKISATNLVIASNGVSMSGNSNPTVVSGGSGGTDGGQDVTFTNGGGTGATGRVNVISGVPTGTITINNPGSGYTSVPTQGTVSTVTGTVTFTGGALAAEFTSASHSFTNEDIRRDVVITAGSGFTAGTYQILYATGGTALVSTTAGTVGSTGGTFSLAGCLGVDADDRDPNLHSTAQVLTKYGTVAAFYAHLGSLAGNTVDTAAYSPTRYWVLAASGGNDGTCTAHTFGASPDPTAVTACATQNHINSVAVAGDMTIMRGGTYSPGISLFTITSGTSSQPIINIAYPGELPVVDFAGAGGYVYDAMSYWIVDGLKILNASSYGISGGSNYGGPPYLTTGPSRSQGIRIRNTEITLCTRGIFIFDGLLDMIIEDNVIHDEDTVGGTHNIYLGGRSNPSSTITIQRNILYGGGYTGLQFNGRTSALTVQSNLIYGNALGCISMEMGVTNSTFRNNVCIGNGRSGIVFYDYESGLCFDGSGNPSSSGTFGVCPFDQTGNLIENNSVYQGQYDFHGNASTMSIQPCLLTINDASLSAPHSFTGNVFRNNTCTNWDGYLGNIGGGGSPTLPATQLTLQNNIYVALNRAGTNVIWDLTTATFYTFPQMAALTGFSVSGNAITDPLYTSANVNWWSQMGSYNLQLQPTSPGINTASTTSVPTNDVLGNTRTVTPSIGAYQYASGGTAIPLNTWTNVLTHGQPIQAVGWEKLLYSRASKQSIYQGSFHQQSNEPNTAFVAYEFEPNYWSVSDMTGMFSTEHMAEGGHQDGLFAYDSTRNVYIAATCCMTFGRQPENPYHLWWYDPVGQVGRDKHQSPRIDSGSGNQGTEAYDAMHDMVIAWAFQGTTWYTWECAPSTNICTAFSPSPQPIQALQQASMAYNPDDGHVYLFGGAWGGVTFYNKVWQYDQPTHTWVDLTISGSKPAGRWEAGWAYDTLNHVFLTVGGFLDSGGTQATDSWAFDPVALTWTQVSSLIPNAGTSSFQTFERLAYDSDHNVFIAMLTASSNALAYASDAQWAWTSFPTQTWLYRYNGVGPNVGTLTYSPTPAAGSLSRTSTGWSKDANIVVSGTTLYSSHSEIGTNSDASQGTWAKIYADNFTSSWSQMGSSWAAIVSETTTGCNQSNEAHEPSLAIVSSVPWVAYYAGCEQREDIFAKSWGGSSWSGGVVGLVDPFSLGTNNVFQGHLNLIAVGSTPYLGFLETEGLDGNGNQEQLLFVKHYNGSSWVTDGGYLNRGRTAGTTTVCTAGGGHCSRARSVSLATDGAVPIVAFTEYLTNDAGTDTVPQVFVSQLSGSTWNAIGGAVSTSGAWAYDACITYMGGKPYVAWTERTASGPAQVFVKTFSSGTWNLIGSGTLNKDTSTGWAFRPSLTNDGTNIYLAWVEQQAIGQRSQTYVDKWNGSAWSAVGSSLNVATTTGSAQGVSVAVLSGQPVASWSEINAGAQRQLYAKQWNGSVWVSLGATGTTGGSSVGGKSVTGGTAVIH